MTRFFTTFHTPGEHRAIVRTEEIGPFPTEIDLVRALANMGIDLKQLQHRSTGSGFRTTVRWF